MAQTESFEETVRQEFNAIDPNVRLRWDQTLDYPASIRGSLSIANEEEPRQIADAFLETHKVLLKIEDPKVSLKFDSTKTDNAGNSRTFYYQFHRRLPVWGGYIAIFSDKTGVTAYESKYHLDISKKLDDNTNRAISSGDLVKNTPISPEAVISVAEKHSNGKPHGKPFLLIYPFGGSYHLAYHVEASGVDGTDPADWIYFIDAHSGKIIDQVNTIDFAGMVDGSGIGINLDETAKAPERHFRVYHSDDGNYYLRNTEISPEVRLYDIAGGGDHDSFADRDTLSMDTNGVWGDYNNLNRADNQRPEAEGYWALHRIVEYYSRDKVVNGIHLFNRNGWDNAGGDWRMVVHYRMAAGTDHVGSFFSRNATYGSRVYHGDGDGTNLTYKASLDTTAHEWVHGVQFSEIPAPVPGSSSAGFNGGLADSFAIKEATADVLACCLDTLTSWHMGTEFSEDVTYYSGSYGNGIGFRLRSIQDPSIYNDTSNNVQFSDHMNSAACSSGRGYIAAPGKRTGYLNCTIFSRALYMMAMGGTHPVVASYNEIQVIGQGIGFVENIVYHYLVQHALAEDSLQDFRDKMILSCQDLYPGDSCKEWCVVRAFDAVGLYDDAIGGITQIPAGVNLSITPWGSKSGQAPFWQSPDVYCLDSSDAVTEPVKNQANRLIAVVRNNGSVMANGTAVNFYFSPFGMGYRHEDFKLIGTNTVDVPAGGSEVVAEVAWDLTDLTDDFGGVWPAPISDFDHFCVRVEVIHPDEVFPCDNNCQHNFANVTTVPDGDGDGVWKFIIANPFRRPVWAVIDAHTNLPETMKYKLGMIGEVAQVKPLPQKPSNLTKNQHLVPLAAMEKRIAELGILIPHKDALSLFKGRGGRKNLKSLQLTTLIDGEEVGGIEVGFFGTDLWNHVKKSEEKSTV